MKFFGLSISMIFTVFAVFFICISDSAKPNRTRFKFLDDHVFLYSHSNQLYLFDSQGNAPKLIHELKGGKQLSDIFTFQESFDVNILVKDYFESYFIALSHKFSRSMNSYTLNECGLGDYAQGERLFITRNGRFLASITKEPPDNPILECFDLSKNICISKFFLGTNELRDIDMTDDGKVIVLNFYKGGGLNLLFPQTNQIGTLKSGLGGDYFFDFALSPNGEKVFSISSGGELWDTRLNMFEFIFRWNEYANDFEAFRWSKNFDKSVYYRPTPDPFNLTSKKHGIIKKALFSENSDFLFLLISLEGSVKFSSSWRLKIFDIKNAYFAKTVSIENLNTYPAEIAISPDEKTFIIIDRNANVIMVPISK